MVNEEDDGLSRALHHLRSATELAGKLAAQEKWREASDHIQGAISHGVTQALLELDDMRVALAEKRVKDLEYQLAALGLLSSIDASLKAGALQTQNGAADPIRS